MGKLKYQLLTYLTKTPSFLDMKSQRFLWLIRLRFIALFSQLPLTIVGRYYGYLDQKSHLVFSICLILLLIYNANLYSKVTKDKAYKVKSSFLSWQVCMDLIIFSFLLNLTGGVNNPFYAFFYVMAVFGGIFTTGRGSSYFHILLMTCVFSIQISPLLSTDFNFDVIFNQQTFPYLVSQLLIPSIVFFIARSFGAFLDKSQENLLNLTIHSERLDRLRAVGALSAGFSHEFASPLHTAQIRLKRLGRLLPADNHDLSVCALALEDCEKVLKQMNSSQLHLSTSDYEVIDLGSVISEITHNWKLDYPEITVELTSADSKIRVPRINFTQSLFNLLDNSAEAMGFKGPIELNIATNSTNTVLTITDQGHGFNPEILQRMGEPFNTNKSNGTGLGLYSAHLFMESVAGRLSVSNLTQGSKVELLFPRIS